MPTNWLRFGPITIRTGSLRLASWGHPRVQVGGLSIWSRASDGSLVLASYHPRHSLTWYWSLILTRQTARTGLRLSLSKDRSGQWIDRLDLPDGWGLSFMRQDYHRPRAVTA